MLLLQVRGYPDYMVLAEKIVIAIDRGDQNTRWRDFVDIAAITGAHSIRYDDQRGALDAVALSPHCSGTARAAAHTDAGLRPAQVGRLAPQTAA